MFRHNHRMGQDNNPLAQVPLPSRDAGQPDKTRTTRKIFQEEWWLQAASGGKVDRVAIEADGRSIAQLYFLERRMFGLKKLEMPPHTSTLGPIFDFPPRQPIPRSYRHDVLSRLISKIPKHDYFYQVLGPEDGTAIVFDMCGFAVGVDYTFRIPAETDPGVLWANMDARRRRRIRDRRERLSVRRHTEIDCFMRLAHKEFSSSINYYDFAAIDRAFEAARALRQACVISASDSAGHDVCASVVVWDHDALYFWLAARDHRHAGRGAKSLVTWEAINLSAELGLTFDFDSYGSAGGASFGLTFGLPPVVRPIVSHTTTSAALALACRDMVRAGKKWSLMKLASRSRGR